ncbi:MAG: hypothetical protein ABL961_12515 [Vicinamibacterales bacterium]
MSNHDSSRSTNAPHLGTSGAAPAGPAAESAVMAGSHIGRLTAFVLAVILVGVMTLPLALELPAAARSAFRSAIRTDIGQRGLLAALPEVESHFIYQSRFVSLVRQPYQSLSIKGFHHGSRSVVLGSEGMLFHRNDVVTVAGTGILSNATSTNPAVVDAIAVLGDFHDQLQARGVALLVVAVPGKSMIYPERLWPAIRVNGGPVVNVDYPEWKRRLARRGVDLLDLTDAFWRAKGDASDGLFLRYDTHWSARGVALGADVIAERLRPLLGEYPTTMLRATTTRVVERTDLVDLLGLSGDSPLFPNRSVEVRSLSPASTFDDSEAPVVLFGDSLTGYFDDRRAGLAQQLALRLQTGVERFVGLGSSLPGAIQRAFDDNPRLLSHKRVVVVELQIGQLYVRTFSSLLRVP